ncbi:ATP-binding cassette domain-containing protein [Acidianus sulfidivorans JP7]|uniref:Multidrug ABC transporter ATP-binding protein n=1 Tax=Acidianus sulfidivorans JP7 TaxID=619593 RepID=A0A2U9IKU6_9CREN|nr:ABC transporter ATP-binding protein [Acidianus sulfidivorans]AWR96643.1 ATP-binding cassette domain-containing protein [Acidianus sulfidivorans JP7]
MINRDAIVSVTDLRKYFSKKEILKGLTFNVSSNIIFGIIGPNGAGKTTTLRVLSGIIRHYQGKVSIQGLSPQKAKNLGYISYMPEDSFPYDRLTGKENLEFYASIYAKNKQELEEYIEKGIKIADLGDRIYDKASEYSRGMKRRLMIARTLMVNPKIAILDEPTSALDVESAVNIRNLIRKMKEETTIILSSHNMLEVEFLCDEIILLNNGKIIAQGTPKEISENYGTKNLEEAFIQATSGEKK